MIFDSPTNRYILHSGSSIVPLEDLLDRILKGGQYEHCLLADECADSRKYEIVTGRRIVAAESDLEATHVVQEGDINVILDRVSNSARMNGTDEELERIEQELTFFEEQGKLYLINKLIELIDTFKRDNIVWGVGRGSSCASYLMYVLEVNDVNPLEFDIPFSEMSKQ
jgi:DNA polymerase III alpha subunit